MVELVRSSELFCWVPEFHHSSKQGILLRLKEASLKLKTFFR